MHQCYLILFLNGDLEPLDCGLYSEHPDTLTMDHRHQIGAVVLQAQGPSYDAARKRLLEDLDGRLAFHPRLWARLKAMLTETGQA